MYTFLEKCESSLFEKLAKFLCISLHSRMDRKKLMAQVKMLTRERYFRLVFEII